MQCILAGVNLASDPALMINNQMQLKTAEPTHGTFASARESCKGFVAIDVQAIAYFVLLNQEIRYQLGHF